MNKLLFQDELEEVNKNGVGREAVVYLDNATIINACTLLSKPESFDLYKLLDLESFCEAFLLYDRVHTLVGYSFMSALGRYSEVGTESLYSKLIDKDLLIPVLIGAGSVNYHIDNIDLLDEVASSISVAQTVEQVRGIFGQGKSISIRLDKSNRKNLMYCQ